MGPLISQRNNAGVRTTPAVQTAASMGPLISQRNNIGSVENPPGGLRFNGAADFSAEQRGTAIVHMHSSDASMGPLISQRNNSLYPW